MGIRFYCPNGHKLNVKAFLAGKRGICPHCGAKLQIPLRSTLEPGNKGGSGEKGDAGDCNYPPATEPSAGGATAPQGEVEEDSSPDVSESFFPVDHSATFQEPVVSIEMRDDSAAGADYPVSGPSKPPELPQAKPLPGDPLDEAPDAVWYVRVSGGGQYGPAAAEVMRQWLEEGRIGGECLVWREGWRDWREALATFPSLRDGSIPRIDTGGVLPGRSEPGGVTGAGEYSRSSRSRSTMVRAVVITVLLLVVIAGSVALAWVLW